MTVVAAWLDGAAWLTMTKPQSEPRHVQVEDQDVEALVAEFEAIGEDSEKFEAFVNAVAVEPTRVRL